MMVPRPAAQAARSSRSPVCCDVLEGRRLFAASVTITPTRAQTIEGFGTSLGGSTQLALVNTPRFQKAYYQDLGASVFRAVLNPWILAGETKNGKKSIGAPVTLGPNVRANAELFDFNNGNIKKYGRMARAAAKYGDEVKIIGSFWSPPFWMKGEEVSPSSGKPNGVMPTFNDSTGNTSGGSLIDSEENLTQFGRYIAAYVYGFQKAYGVTLHSISIQNELAFHQSYSSAVYSPELYAKALKAADRWMAKAGLTTRIVGPEDVGVGATDNTGILNRQMNYIKAVRADKDAFAALDGYAIHGYAADGRSDMRSPDMWARYWNGYDGGSSWNSFDGIKDDAKPSWMTETSGYSGTWNSTLRLASGITDALVQGNVSGYVYWGISNYTSNGEALMQGADYASGKYNAFKHFSKFVRPGAVRLETSETDPFGVYVSAFADDAAKTLTSVLVNNLDTEQDVTIRLDGIDLAKFGTAFASVEGDTWYAMNAMRVSGGRVTFTIPARSVVTLVGNTAGAAQRATPTGMIGGVYFMDANANQRADKGETAVAGAKVFLDLDADGTRDKREPMTVTNQKGVYTFTGLPNGVYRVRRVLASAFAQTTEPTVTRLRKGATAIDGVNLGVVAVRRPTTGASIAGHAFADTNANGRQDGTEPNAVAKLVFLDADNDGRLDRGEITATTNPAGDFGFTGLAAGTYRVRRVFPQGFTASTTTIALTLAAGEQKTGVLIGSRAV